MTHYRADSTFGSELRHLGIPTRVFAQYCNRTPGYIRSVANGTFRPSPYLWEWLERAKCEITSPDRVLVLKIEWGLRHNSAATFSPDELRILRDHLPVLFPLYGANNLPNPT